MKREQVVDCNTRNRETHTHKYTLKKEEDNTGKEREEREINARTGVVPVPLK